MADEDNSGDASVSILSIEILVRNIRMLLKL
jgi:hypothetical protein